jgi:hypothetical protein
MTMEPWQWILLGTMLLGLFGLVLGIFLEEKRNKKVRAVLDFMFGDVVTRQTLQEQWDALGKKGQKSLAQMLPSAFKRMAQDASDMFIIQTIIETLGMGVEVRTAVIKNAALRFPEDESVFDHAIKYWATLPDDLLKTFALADVKRIPKLVDDFQEKPSVRDEVAKVVAKTGNMEALHGLYVGTDPPEALLKECAAAALPATSAPE